MGLLSTVLRRSHFRFLGLLFVIISCSLLFLSWTSSERPDFDPSFGDHDDLPRHRFAWTKPPSRPWKHNHVDGERWDIADTPPAELNTTGGVWEDRADKVRQAFLHAYRSYDKCARGADELLPLTCTGTKNFNGWGVTLVEALDTMWVMGLYDEFGDALSDVAQMDFGMAEHERAPFFETVIRYLGGLLSAYALSGEAIFVVRADRLGAALLPAFDTPSGFPTYSVNTETGATGSSWVPGAAFWAEVFSCQLEYKYLAYLTGKKEYYERAENLMQRLYTANTDATGGLYPTKWKTSSGEPMNDQVSVGALADSGYEYLLKQYLLSGRTDIQARDTYIKSANLIISNLLFVTPDRGLLYVTDTSGLKQIPSHTMEHLSCFLPGLFALGVHTLGDLLTPAERELHMWAARGLGQTCYIMYADQPSGLAPEEITMMSWMGPYNAHRTAEDVKIEGLWMTHLKKWQAEGEGDDRENVGQGGDPPGVREVNPIKEAVGNINIMKSREYRIKRTPYLLRPETVESFHLLWTVTGDSVWRERGWEVFEAIERNTKVEKGYASVDDVTRLPTKKMNMMPSFFLAETLKYLYLLFTDEEIIPLDQWVFNTEAHPLPVFEWSNWEKKHYGIP